MASGNRRRQRSRKTIRGGIPWAKRVRKSEPRIRHVQRRFLERYGFELTKGFRAKIVAEIEARRFVRDTWRPNLLQVIVHGQPYNLVWDPTIKKIITFYPREDFRVR